MPADSSIPSVLIQQPKNPFPFPINNVPASSPNTTYPTQSIIGTPVGSAIGGGTIYQRPDGSTFVAPTSPSDSLGTGGYTPSLPQPSGTMSIPSGGGSSSGGSGVSKPVSYNPNTGGAISNAAPLAASQPYNPVGEAISNSYYGINKQPLTQSESEKYSFSNVNWKGGFNTNGQIYLSDYVNYKFAKGANYVTDAWASVIPESKTKAFLFENKRPFSVWHLGVGTAFAPTFSTGSESLFRSIKAGDIIPESNTKIIASVKNVGEGVSRVDVIGTTESMGKTSSGFSSQFVKDIDNGKSISIGKGINLLSSGKTTQATEYELVSKNFNSKVLGIKDFGKLVLASPSEDISSVSSISFSRDIASIKNVPNKISGVNFGTKTVNIKVNPLEIKSQDTFGLFKNADSSGNILAYRGTSTPVKYPSGFGAFKEDFNIRGYVLRSPGSSEVSGSNSVNSILKFSKGSIKSVQEQSSKLATTGTKNIINSLPKLKAPPILPSASALSEPKASQSQFYGTGKYELTNQEIIFSKSRQTFSQSQNELSTSKLMSTNTQQEFDITQVRQPTVIFNPPSIKDINIYKPIESSRTGSRTIITPDITQITTPRSEPPPKIINPNIPNINTPPRWELPPVIPSKIKFSFDESLSTRSFGVKGKRKYFPSYDAIIKNIRGKAPKSAITNALGTRPMTSRNLLPSKSKFKLKGGFL